MKVSCLGPEGSFSQRAAEELCAGAEVLFAPTFAEAVRLLTAGEADFCVLPVENALNGGVGGALDLISSEKVFGVRELPLPIDQRLATLEGVKVEDIRFVYSHEQAIAQCKEYLRTKLPQAQWRFTPSTVESLSRLDQCSAGIVGAHVRREGVVLSKENIADDKGNFTRFLLLERAGSLPERSAMVFLAAVCAHRPGSLLGLLRIFQRYSLNLTRIESRPVKGAFGQYRFFIEFAGNLAEERVKAAIREAEAYCETFKLLGAYG